MILTVVRKPYLDITPHENASQQSQPCPFYIHNVRMLLKYPPQMTGQSNDKSSSSNSSIVDRLSTIDESGSEKDVDSGLENSATTQETTCSTLVQDQADQMILFTNIETVRSEESNDDTKSVLSYSSLSVSLKSN